MFKYNKCTKSNRPFGDAGSFLTGKSKEEFVKIMCYKTPLVV